ncbi:diguanylate cyclase domain-containing protein [Frateuria aurantia]
MNIAKPKLLVVDDMTANLVAMRHLLADCGAEIYEASSGNQALALCLDHQFALVLLDVNMPDMDGFEVAQWINESEQLGETPIIFLTAAYGDDPNRIKGYRMGAIDYIAKPINDIVLQSKVRVFLELYHARQQLQQVLRDLAERNQQLLDEITVRKRIEAQVRYEAAHDPLTGLPNRSCFFERLQQALVTAIHQDRGFAVVCFDLDGFKSINDEFGHAAGDALLCAIASRIHSMIGGDDTAARLGGDEFALILRDFADTGATMERCEFLREHLTEPYQLSYDGQTVTARIGASFGYTLWHDAPDQGPDQMIRRADQAMYDAKRSGKNRSASHSQPEPGRHSEDIAPA